MDNAEWPHIVREHGPLVWRTVYRLLAHHADATDCFQETFVCAWKVASRQPVRNWAGLLQRIATMRALDQLRSRRRRAKQFAPAPDIDDVPSTGSAPPAQLQLAELCAQLRKALVDLPEQMGETYCLRHLNGLSYEEIADELGISASAVGVNLHRATQRLRVLLCSVPADQSTTGEP